MTLGTGLPSIDRDQDVGRLQVAVDDALLMRVLHRLADRHEEFQPLFGGEPGLVAELGQRQAVDQLHDEERLAGGRQAAVEHLGDVGMIHHRQRLPLLLEALQHGLRVHAGLDQLQRHLALDRLGLLGDPDLAHAPFADFFLERVTPRDDDAGLGLRAVVGGRGGRGRCVVRAWSVVEGGVRMGLARARIHGLGRGPVENVARLFVCRQECLDGRPEFRPPRARLVQEGGTLVGRSGQRFLKECFFVHVLGSDLADDFVAKPRPTDAPVLRQGFRVDDSSVATNN